MVIKNLQRPDEPGTVIQTHATQDREVVKSVSHKMDFCILKAYGSGAGYQAGTMSKISGRLGEAGINIYSATTSQTCISLLIEQSAVDRATAALETLLKEVIERYEVHPDIALVCIVGAGLARARGLASRVFRAVADADINVDLISAGASPVAFHFTVQENDLEATVKAVHREFFERGEVT